MMEVLLLAMALAMDTFGLAIGLGTKSQKQSRQYVWRLAIYAALYFGIAQAIMPMFGYLLGSVSLGWVATAAPWIGGTILIALGSKMIYDVFTNNKDDVAENGTNVNTTAHANRDDTGVVTENLEQSISHRTMFTLAIATSIDAMAAGFTLNVLAINALLACLIIAVVTAGFCLLGVYIGWRSGTWSEGKAEVLGGLALTAIGLKMMFFG